MMFLFVFNLISVFSFFRSSFSKYVCELDYRKTSFLHVFEVREILLTIGRIQENETAYLNTLFVNVYDNIISFLDILKM